MSSSIMINNASRTSSSPLATANYEKPKIMVPPIRYDLRKFLSNSVIEQVEVFTRNDSSATEFIENFKDKLLQRAHPTVFGYIPAPPDQDIIKQVIGLNGYFFKMTTTLCGVDFIWHNHTTQMFYFWGPTTFSVVKALNSIRWRIQKFYEMKFEDNRRKAVADALAIIKEDEEDNSEMPRLISSAEMKQLLEDEAKAKGEDEAKCEDTLGELPESKFNAPPGMMRSISMGCEPEYENPSLN